MDAAHFLFCDGHVRYLTSSMDYTTYKALSTRRFRRDHLGRFLIPSSDPNSERAQAMLPERIIPPLPT